MVGGTLLWADHYLVKDHVSESLIADSRSASLEDDLRELLLLRPLIETGMVVPVLEQAAALIAGEAARRQAELDLRRPGLAEWVEGQLVMEGPTARQYLIYSVLDDDDPTVSFFMYSPLEAVKAHPPGSARRRESPGSMDAVSPRVLLPSQSSPSRNDPSRR